MNRRCYERINPCKQDIAVIRQRFSHARVQLECINAHRRNVSFYHTNTHSDCKAHTRGRTDHASNISAVGGNGSTRKFSAGCYLFMVSNSDLLVSYRWPKQRLPSLVFIVFNLELWPMTFENDVDNDESSACQISRSKVILFKCYSRDAYTQTHTHREREREREREEVILELVRAKCIPILLYGLVFSFG